MPCFTKIGAALESGRFDIATLERALKWLGFEVMRDAKGLSFDRLQEDPLRAARGEFPVGGPLELLAVDAERGALLLREVRQAYTREAITFAARRHGLRVEQDAKDPMVIRLGTNGRAT